MHDAQNLSQYFSFSVPPMHHRTTKDAVRYDHASNDSPVAWVGLRDVDSAVDAARPDPAEVAHTDHHRECHAALNVAAREPTCTGECDSDGGEHTTGRDDSTAVRDLRRGSGSPKCESDDRRVG